jgi:GNAT superfamily N-acetyltransferase
VLPELLIASHEINQFSCGSDPLDVFLKRYALTNQRAGGSRTYVIARDKRVVGYYTLAPGSVDPLQVPDRVAKGQPRHPIPVILLARLAIDASEQGRGLGKHLLLDAFRRAIAGAEVVGGRAVLVHAKDQIAFDFYQHFGGEQSPTDPLHLFFLIKDLRALFNVTSAV